MTSETPRSTHGRDIGDEDAETDAAGDEPGPDERAAAEQGADAEEPEADAEEPGADAAGDEPGSDEQPAAAAPAGAVPADDVPDDDPASAVEVAASVVVSDTHALTWIEEESVAASAEAPFALDTSPVEVASADLLAVVPRRTLLRPGVIVPSVLIGSLIAAYAATTLLWPLHAVPPQIRAVPVDPVPAAAAAPAWPAEGSAGIAVVGIPGTLADSTAQLPIASITKVVTCLMVLDELPLAPGEQGVTFSFSEADSDEYRQYLAGDESALDVPVGGTLSQFQLMQGILIGSANNYADRLAGYLWPDDAVFSRAAADWLALNGIDGVTLVNPSGMDPRNTATHDGLIKVAAKALANPVIAEIVRTQGVDIPGAGWVENTNKVLVDPGMLGIKTGYYETLNLLSAKEVAVGDTTVRMLGSVLGQPSSAARDAATRALYAQTEAELQPQPSVTKGTSVGVVETRWSDPVTIVTADDASVVLWNGGVADISTRFDLGDRRTAGDTVGELSATGPLNATAVEVRLADDVPDPSPWWRLTHPLDLFGLSG